MNAARASDLAAKMRGATSPPPIPDPVAPVKPATPAARPVLGRFTVRLYDAGNVAAWTEVRTAIAAELGKIPSQSEVAEVAARALLDSPEALSRAAELLRGTNS